MKVAIGSDHAGYEYKEYLKSKLEEWGIKYSDHGTDSAESTDYPDYAHPVAEEVAGTRATKYGILICGSGNGVCMSANKHEKIRAALCWNTELAELARQHNDANILCIPARFVGKRTAAAMLKKFVHTSFEGGRHKRRVKKISC